MTKSIFASLIFWLLSITLSAQSFNHEERLQGYAHKNDKLYFLFDETQYGIQPYHQLAIAQQKTIRNEIPMIISEAEPTEH